MKKYTYFLIFILSLFIVISSSEKLQFDTPTAGAFVPNLPLNLTWYGTSTGSAKQDNKNAENPGVKFYYNVSIPKSATVLDTSLNITGLLTNVWEATTTVTNPSEVYEFCTECGNNNPLYNFNTWDGSLNSNFTTYDFTGVAMTKNSSYLSTLATWFFDENINTWFEVQLPGTHGDQNTIGFNFSATAPSNWNGYVSYTVGYGHTENNNRARILLVPYNITFGNFSIENVLSDSSVTANPISLEKSGSLGSINTDNELNMTTFGCSHNTNGDASLIGGSAANWNCESYFNPADYLDGTTVRFVYAGYFQISSNRFRFGNSNTESDITFGTFSGNTNNVTLDVGDDGDFEFNHESNFTTMNTTGNFSQEINDFLSTCTADNNGNCSVPLVFFSENNARIGLTNLNITYNTAPDDVILETPSNNSYTNDNTPTLNWGNSTDNDTDTITYYLEVYNDTLITQIAYFNSSITEIENITNDTTTTLEDGDYYWRVFANDNNFNSTSSGEFNLTVDTINPDVLLDDIPDSTSARSACDENISFTYSESDNNLESCWYNIYSSNGETLETDNTTISSCVNSSFISPSGCGIEYTFNLYVNDSAENENLSTDNYTLTLSVSLPGSAAGGSGGGAVVVTPTTVRCEAKDTNWTVSPPSFRAFVWKDIKRNFEMELSNFADEDVDVNVHCKDDENSTLKICNYIIFDNTNLTLPANVLDIKNIKAVLFINKSLKEDINNIFPTLIFSDGKECKNLPISLELIESPIGLVNKVIELPFSKLSPNFNNYFLPSIIPTIMIFFITLLVGFNLINKLMDNIGLSLLSSFTLSLTLSLLFLILI